MTRINVTWPEMKQIQAKKKVRLQYLEKLNAYNIFLADGGLTWFTAVYKPPTEAVSDDGHYVEAHYNEWLTLKSTYDGSVEPRTDDGRAMFQPVTLDRGLWHWYTSDGDGAGRGDGQAFEVQLSAEGTESIEWKFNDWVEMAGGVCMFDGAKIGDWVAFEVFMPATQAANTPGTGNANKVPVPNTGGTMNVFVPAAGNGDWTINLASSEAVPVIASGGNGFWHWSWPDTGVGTVTPSVPSKGSYNLFDFAVDPATRFIPRVRILGSHLLPFTPDNVHPTDVLPHWRMRFKLHHGPGEHDLAAVFYLITARKDTR